MILPRNSCYKFFKLKVFCLKNLNPLLKMYVKMALEKFLSCLLYSISSNEISKSILKNKEQLFLYEFGDFDKNFNQFKLIFLINQIYTSEIFFFTSGILLMLSNPASTPKPDFPNQPHHLEQKNRNWISKQKHLNLI